MVIFTMSFTYLILLSVTQSIGEFLPISSSAHLILIRDIFSMPQDNAILVDVSLHLGTLLAIFVYFKKEVGLIFKGFLSLLRLRLDDNGKLFLKLALASVPLTIFGAILVFTSFIDVLRDNLYILAFNLIFFAVIMWIADSTNIIKFKSIHSLPISKAFIVGCGQMIALIPGVSRSGITISVARFLGCSRDAAVKFSILLSVPSILMAFGKIALDSRSSVIDIDYTFIIYGIILTFVLSLVVLFFFIKFVNRYSLKVFVIYRVLLAALILIFAL